MEPLPPAYRQLGRWYPRLADRARALGLSRQTLTSWERDPDGARVRHATARRVNLLASVTAEVEEAVGEATGAGAWMSAPQPLADGATPAALVREGRLRELHGLMFAPEKTVGTRRVRVGARHDPAPSLPGTVRRERPRSPEGARVLRMIGEDPAAIGPIRA